ncbi:MAG: hypothetical protein WCI17_01265, partial [bacterium]
MRLISKQSVPQMRQRVGQVRQLVAFGLTKHAITSTFKNGTSLALGYLNKMMLRMAKRRAHL